jgi:DNA (cytosine-5)-methyltransferase 1
LKRHWPNVPKHDDITTANGMMFGPADVVTFGSPCQDLSVAGKRLGMAGERSGLFGEALRFIDEMRRGTGGLYPKLSVWENVPGAFSSNGGRDFALVLRGLAKLGALDVAWRVLDSRHFGVAQRRRRVFLVADFAGERAAEILSLSEGVRRDTPKGRDEGQDLAACLTTGIGQRYDAKTETLIPVAFDAKAHQSRSMNPSELSPALEAQQKVAVAFTERGREGGRSLEWQEDIAYALTAPTGGPRSQEKCVAYGIQDDATPKIGHDVMPTLRARDGAGSSGQYVSSPYAVRRLTPTECERLQGFPDGWTRYTADGREIADTHRYRMCGNAVTVSVVEWIARRMAEA